MVSKKIVIRIPAGLHLRPISVLCNRAIDYKSNISIKLEEKTVNAKSVLGVLSACVKYEDEIELICEGPDEEEALEVLSDMIQKGLGDEFIKK
ncbi:HPr family phosphocarrier protein [Mobilitalea sibirica]|uniref:HPr family phosphocarrier protein n=1 Tax=Mobilitalea sibirica TaxID=1462919 RepID=A0A8J7L2D5_9FIRM|nr:HPr family phosphocarrier protein [Mobilitalea sibirica]MBH1940373.1 HPr family phosphocarrier protein [Mobilitalea sibirica]